MKNFGMALVKNLLIIFVAFLFTLMTSCMGVIVSDLIYDKSSTENGETGDIWENLYYKKYSSESFYYTLTDLKDQDDTDYSGYSYSDLIKEQDSLNADDILGTKGLQQASLNQVIKDVDNMEDNLTLNYLRLKKLDEYLNHPNGIGFTNPSQLIKPVATNCNLYNNDELDIKNCELIDIYNEETGEILVNSQKYSETADGIYQKDGVTVNDNGEVEIDNETPGVSDYGLGSLVHYQAYYQPARINNYNFQNVQVIDNSLSYSDVKNNPESVYKYLNAYEVKQDVFDEYSQESENFLTPNGVYATGYYEPSSDPIVYKNWEIGVNSANEGNLYSSYKALETSYSNYGFSSKEEAWAKTQADVSTGVPLTTVAFVIDHAVTMLGTYDFDINQEWTYLSDATNTETTYYFKDYDEKTFDKPIDLKGATPYIAVYDKDNNLVGYAQDYPTFTPVTFTNVNVIPDIKSVTCHYSEKDETTNQLVRKQHNGYCEEGLLNSSETIVRNTSDCDRKFGETSCELTESDAASKEKCGSGYCDYRVNNGGEGNYGYWTFHIVLTPEWEWTDEYVQLQGVTSKKNSTAWLEKDVKYEEFGSRTSSILGFYFKPSYLFKLTANLKGTLEMQIVKHASTSISTKEEDNTMYLKDYMTVYEMYYPNENSQWDCVNEYSDTPKIQTETVYKKDEYGNIIETVNGVEVETWRGACTDEEIEYLVDNTGYTIRNTVGSGYFTAKQVSELEKLLNISNQDTTIPFTNRSLIKTGMEEFDNIDEIRVKYADEVKTASGETGIDDELLFMLIAERPNNYILNGVYSGYNLSKLAKDDNFETIDLLQDNSELNKVRALGYKIQSLMSEYANNFPYAITVYEAGMELNSFETGSKAVMYAYQNYVRALGNSNAVASSWQHVLSNYLSDSDYKNNVTWYHYLPASYSDFSDNFFQHLKAYSFTFITLQNKKIVATIWNKKYMSDDALTDEMNGDLLTQYWFLYKNTNDKEAVWKLLTSNQESINKANYITPLGYRSDISGYVGNNFGYYKKEFTLENDIISEMTSILTDPNHNWNDVNVAVIDNDIGYFATSLNGLQSGVKPSSILNRGDYLDWPLSQMSGCSEAGTCKVTDRGSMVTYGDVGTEIKAPISGTIIPGITQTTIYGKTENSKYNYFILTIWGLDSSGNFTEESEVKVGDVIGVQHDYKMEFEFVYGTVQEDQEKPNILYTGNFYNLIQSAEEERAVAAQMYVNWSMFLPLLRGGYYYGDLANQLWNRIFELKQSGVILYGADYNCTAFSSFILYEAYGIEGIAGDGSTKVDCLMSSAYSSGFTRTNTLPQQETGIFLFSVGSKDTTGHTGCGQVRYDSELGWVVDVFEGNMGPVFGEPGTGVKIGTVLLDDWNRKYASIDYAISNNGVSLNVDDYIPN